MSHHARGYVQRIQADQGFFGTCHFCGSDPFKDRSTVEEVLADLRAHGCDIYDIYGDTPGMEEYR